MAEKRLSRRMFLCGAAGATLAVPYLPSISRVAAAPPPAGLRRIVFMAIPYGAVQEQWFGEDSSRPTGVTVGRAQETQLSDFRGDISPVFRRSAIGEYYDQMCFLDGIDAPYSTGHEKSFALSAALYSSPSAVSAPTIDQLIAQHAEIYPTEPTFRIMNVAAGAGTHHGPSLSYVRNGDRIVPFPQVANPATVWDLAFENVAGGLDSSGFERLRRNRISVIDRVRGDYDRLLGHRNLSRVDRDRLEAHASYLREYESSIEDSMLLDCDSPMRPDVESFPRGARSWPELGMAQVDNIVHSLRCGLTNVVTFNSEPSARSYAFPEVTTSSHHSLSHSKESSLDNEATRQLLAVHRHKIDMVARLLRGLDMVEEPATGRTFLDNTLVVLTSDMGSVSNHKGQRMPVVLFGARGFIKQGVMLDFRTHNIREYNGCPRSAGVGIAYNAILVTACRAMGLEPEQFESGGSGIGLYRPSKYYYNLFSGGEDEYIVYAYGDRRAPPPELLDDA